MKTIRKARLADIDVDEVSYVDKAANKRKFLFVKRDNSEDERKGGKPLNLLKIFQKNEDAIKALDGINANLEAFDKVFDTLLRKADLTEEQRKMLLAKREEYNDIKEDIDSGFESLFLDKQDEEEEEDLEEEEGEEGEEGEESEETPEEEEKEKKKAEDKKDKKEEDEDEEKEEDEEVAKKDGDSKENEDKRDKLVEEIKKQIAETAKNIEEVQKIYSK